MLHTVIKVNMLINSVLIPRAITFELTTHHHPQENPVAGKTESLRKSNAATAAIKYVKEICKGMEHA